MKPVTIVIGTLLTLLAASMGRAAEAAPPAFPGAEGHGRYVTGGRGGTVYHVTRLEDDGRAGSLRFALAMPGPKTIVFDVGGYIDLRSPLHVTSSTTIAGQTAPYPGITLRYQNLSLHECNNVIMRFIRVRRSQVKSASDDADAVAARNRKNLIIDHCSFSWGIDEVASFYDNREFTLQWCLIGEGLNNAGHSKGAHGYGGIWGGKNASFHHNMIVHVKDRIPMVCGAKYNSSNYDTERYASSTDAERVDLRNNMFYNWSNGSSHGGAGGGYCNIVGNYYEAGEATKNPGIVHRLICSIGSADNGVSDETIDLASRYWIAGNAIHPFEIEEPMYWDWAGVKYDERLQQIDGQYYTLDPRHRYGDTVTYVANAEGIDCVSIRLDNPIDAGVVTTHEVKTLHDKLLQNCGMSLWRDETDMRYINETSERSYTYTGPVSRQPGIVDLINDPEGIADPSLPSFPPMVEGRRPESFDTDGDGMPDAWEISMGLNPGDATDGNLFTLDPRGWYTNLEVYLNSLVERIMREGNEDATAGVDEYYPELTKASVTLPSDAREVVGESYYTLQGIKTKTAPPGMSLKVTLYSDGSVVTTKNFIH